MTRVTITDIAERAGVSAGTVDRVIHKRGEVAAKTREKVLQIIREMNYEPDILASILASKKTIRFAALLPKETNPFWQKPAEGLFSAWNEIKPFGVAVEKFHFPYNDKAVFFEKLEEIIESKPDGLVMAPIFTDGLSDYLQTLNQQKIPYVFLNTQMENQENIAFVGQDSRQSGRVAARLLDYSVEDDAEVIIINFISQKGGNSHIFSREQGFHDYFNSNPKAGRKNMITLNANAQNTDNLENQLFCHLKMNEKEQKTRGIFVTNSRVFLVADFLVQEKIENVRVIGYDLLEENIRHLKNDTIDFLIGQKPHEQGYQSIMALFNVLIRKKEVIRNHFLPIDIITKENIDYYLNI